MKKFVINDLDLYKSQKTYIIAELSANHNNDYDFAARTIEAMAKSGADAVKFQTYTADSMTLNVDKDIFKARKGTIWEGKKLYELYQEGSMPYEWQEKLKKVAEDLGMDCFSAPFDLQAVDFLESINVPAYKIASLEISDIPLIEYVASKDKPVIISTGVANLEDVELAVEACRKMGNDQISVLRCTSAYPTPMSEVNLQTIPFLKERFGVLPGLSDHTLGAVVPVGAVALGARIVEKHFILDKSKGGIDSAFSLEPEEFKSMVDAVRAVEQALGEKDFKLSKGSEGARRSMRSLFVVGNVKKGDKFTAENVRSIRPGLGLHPKFLQEVLGKTANKDIEKGTPFEWNLAD